MRKAALKIMPDERKNELIGDMLMLTMERYGSSDAQLFHELCDNFRMSEEELHAFSIDSLDDFIDDLRAKAIKDWNRIHELFNDHNRNENAYKEPLEARVIVAASSFTQTFSPESRTYMYDSNNKAFDVNMNGTSIFGTSVDLSDSNVRIDGYLASYGWRWKLDGCFIVDNGNLSRDERAFCSEYDISIVKKTRNPVWPEPFNTMYAEKYNTVKSSGESKANTHEVLLECPNCGERRKINLLGKNVPHLPEMRCGRCRSMYLFHNSNEEPKETCTAACRRRNFQYAVSRLTDAGYLVKHLAATGARVKFKESDQFTGLYPCDDMRPGYVEIDGKVQNIDEWINR